MAIDLQAKLLRVLETGELLRVGESKITRVNVRVIAATNRDLSQAIAQGYFREDLFYRLAVFQIRLPALRERNTDIEPLAKHFVQTFALKTHKTIRHLSDDFMNALRAHAWRGNLRELKNVIERSIILTDTDELTLMHLPFELQQPAGTTTHTIASPFDLSSVEKTHIQKVLLYTQGNKAEAAKLLNIGLTTLYRKIEEYKIATS